MTGETNPNFWDCECTTAFIHSKNEPHCLECGATADEMPDSLENEIAIGSYRMCECAEDALSGNVNWKHQ